MTELSGVRRVLAELYDAHTHLSDPPNGAPRWPLFDLLAQRADGMVRIAAIESGSAAADAGLKIGDRIIAIDGRPIERVIHDLMPKCLIRPDPAADAYTINVAVAGYRGKARLLSVSSTTVESDRDHWRKIAQNLAETRSRKWWFW